LKALGETLATPRVAVAVEVPDQPPVVADDVALAVYRIAQEALLNAIRHAETQQVRVVVAGAVDGLRLVVEDDGRGFEPRAEGSRGLGLLGMEQRAMAVGGTLAVESARGRGTRITFTCPARAAT
jgi:protein-histidine pros-kinase